MKIVLITNPRSGTASGGELLHEALAPMGEVGIQSTDAPGGGAELAEAAARAGAELIVAAGGDGTINEVLNGIMRSGQRPCLGVIPLGTGNDLARTLAIPPDPVAAFALLTIGAVRALDVIEILLPDRPPHYAINVAAGGFSGQINEILTEELKAAWGPLAYLRSAMLALPDLTSYTTTIQYGDEQIETIDALNVIVANCRTAAGGVQVAPLANPEDGLLDVVIVRYGSLGDLAGAAARLLVNGNYINSANVIHRRSARLRVRAQPGMWFNADGELLSNEPIEFRALPAAINVIVGPDYQAAVAESTAAPEPAA